MALLLDNGFYPVHSFSISGESPGINLRMRPPEVLVYVQWQGNRTINWWWRVKKYLEQSWFVVYDIENDAVYCFSDQFILQNKLENLVYCLDE